jgi:AraC family transcriptional regulator
MTSSLLHAGAVSAFDYRCSFGPGDKPFSEVHGGFSIAYVRRGGFACTAHGRSYDLTAGSLMIGRPGDEYICSHDHHVCGDECLYFVFAPELVEAIAPDLNLWRARALPPLANVVVAGELAQAVAEGRSDISLEEAGLPRALPQPRTTSRRRDQSHRRAALIAAAWWTSPPGLTLVRTSPLIWQLRPLRST